MLCSISTGKSVSNWLHRLRLSKGFPAADQLDLEQFLSQNAPNLSNSSNTNVTDIIANQIDHSFSSNSAPLDESPVVNGNQVGAEERECSGEMSNVLSEVFYMGDTKRLSKKSCRKQRNPKFCRLSVSKIDDDACTVSGELHFSLDNSRKKKDMSSQLKLKEKEGGNVGHVDGEEEEEEKGNADLSGFSQTEVTVIDTSFPSWKFDKLLFRRKNVWKVRERKCKSIIVNKRKRKASLVSEECYTANTGEEKKQCSSSKDMDGADGLVPSHGGPQEIETRNSSVVLIKSIPTSKKTGANILKSCTKTVQRQHY